MRARIRTAGKGSLARGPTGAFHDLCGCGRRGGIERAEPESERQIAIEAGDTTYRADIECHSALVLGEYRRYEDRNGRRFNGIKNGHKARSDPVIIILAVEVPLRRPRCAVRQCDASCTIRLVRLSPSRLTTIELPTVPTMSLSACSNRRDARTQLTLLEGPTNIVVCRRRTRCMRRSTPDWARA